MQRLSILQHMTTDSRLDARGLASPQSITANALPAELAAVALIDAKTAAAAGSVSLSWWHQAVADGIAPQPARRGNRCTRWRLADVARFWRSFGSEQVEG